MICPKCGAVGTGPGNVCLVCGAPYSAGRVTVTATATPLPVSSSGGFLSTAAVQSGTPESGPLAVGESFGTRYQILKVLGAGGMGVVYQAWDRALEVAVALKVIRPGVLGDAVAAEEVERRFKRELLLARQVTHRNVVRIHDLGEIDGIKYISMPFVEGKNLASLIAERGRFAFKAALDVIRQVGEGLQAAHDAGVVHRDLKPENVMIDADGRPLIMDFGISRTVGGGTTMGLTTAGSVVGTIEYMAPEQALGQAVDQRADIYALGLIGYDLIAGRQRLAAVTTPVAEMMQRLQQPPAPLRTKVPDVPAEVERIISRALEPDPAKRYQQAKDLIADLDAFERGGPAAAIAPRRALSPALIAVALVALLAIAAAGGWFVLKSRQSAAPVAHQPVTVLIADFDNGTKDPLFEGLLEQALGIGLEGASFVAAYPRRDAMRAVAQISPDARLTEQNARLVSQREGIGVVLAGGIQPDGSGYRVSVRAIDSVKGTALATGTAAAADKGKVLEAVGDVAAQIRKALGDTTIESTKLTAGETFTATSLEAAREYSLGQELSNAARDEEAIVHYRRATELDPRFGRAYSGWASIEARLGETAHAKELFEQAFKYEDRMSEREKLRTHGAYAGQIIGNYDQAISIYSELVKKYPSDSAGYNNLAVAYFNTRNFQKALEEGGRVIAVYPKSVLYRYNYALYAMYAGDFATAEREAHAALALNANTPKAYLAIAMAALAAGRNADARQAYEKCAATGPRGVSLAALGLADLDMYEGKYADAIGRLERAIAVDVAAGAGGAAAVKQVALAEARFNAGQVAAAALTAQEAVRQSLAPDVAVPAAAVFVAARREADAKRLAEQLTQGVSKNYRAASRLVLADIALARNQSAEAVAYLQDASALDDLWLVRFKLGAAYAQAGEAAAALTELEQCDRRIGEISAVFLDDVPTFRYRVPLLYWLGKTRVALGQATAHATLVEFLGHRPKDAIDPMTQDARQLTLAR